MQKFRTDNLVEFLVLMVTETEYSRLRAGKDLEMQRLELQSKSFESSLPKQFSLLNIKKGMSILDAGCGTGLFVRSVANIVYPGTVIGLDEDATFIEEGRRLSEKSNLSNVDFKIGDVQNLEFADQTFDLTYCRFVLPHLSNPMKAVSEMIRVTKKDGRVASMDEGGLYVYPSGSLLINSSACLECWNSGAKQIRKRTPLKERSGHTSC